MSTQHRNIIHIKNRQTRRRLMASFPEQPGYAGPRQNKPFWILTKQKIIGWQWHQLDHMQIICTLLQTDNHVSTSSLNFLQAGCSFWCRNLQCQSTEGNSRASMCCCSFGQGSSLLRTHTLRPFYDRSIVLTQERSLVDDVCECVCDWRVR